MRQNIPDLNLCQSTAADPAIGRIASLAVLAIGLGLTVQALVVAAKFGGGSAIAAANVTIDVLAGVTWSLIVCTSVAAATSAYRARPLVAGLVALLCAPLALAAAKAVQQVLTAAMNSAGKPAAVALIAVAALKALEYGLLGYLLARLAQRDVERAGPYLTSGAATGVVFGGSVVALHMSAGAAPAALAAVAVNELLFPIGCAGVVYLGRVMARSAG